MNDRTTGASWRRWFLRWIVRLLVKTVLRPWMPLGLQRWLLDVLAALSLPPRDPRPEPVVLAGVRCWFYPARGDPDTAVLYLHGGGYVAGSPRSHRNVCARLGRLLGADVYAADYRLAPEHPFPAAVDDAFAAFGALAGSRAGLPRGYRRILVMGDSAGGGLALVLALRARDARMRLPDAVVGFSPWVDMTERVDPRTVHDDMLDPRWAEKIAQWYVRDEALDHPWASPLLADLEGLPPVLIQVAESELLAGQGRRLVDALRAAGVAAEFQAYPGVWHVFQTSAGQLPDADRALAAVAAFLRCHRLAPMDRPASTRAAA